MSVKYPDRFRALLFCDIVKQVHQTIISYISTTNEQLLEVQQSKPISTNIDLSEMMTQLAIKLDQMLLPIIANEISLYNQTTTDERNPYDRYQDFFVTDSKATSNITILFDKYKKLFQMMKKYCESFILNIQECLEYLVRIFRDKKKDILTLTPKDSQKSETLQISSLITNISDRHANGKQVVIIVFSLENFKLVYKPFGRQCAQFMHVLIEQINCHYLSKEYHLYTPTLFYATDDEASHNYLCEFIENESCKSTNDVRQFWIKSGILTAISTGFGFTDGHWENIISRGDSPVLIDAETLFYPFVNLFHEDKSSSKYAHLWIQRILLTGFIQELPNPISMTKGESWFAAFQHLPSFNSSLYCPLPMNDHTALLNVTYKYPLHVRSKVIPNDPEKGSVGELREYSEQFIQGFVYGFQVLLTFVKDYHEFLEKEIRKITITRLVLRNTSLYYYLQCFTTQPEHLKNEHELENKVSFYNQVSAIRHQESKRSEISQLYAELNPFEIQALRNMDIPFFCIDFSSSDIPILTNGMQVISDSFLESYRRVMNIHPFDNDHDYRLHYLNELITLSNNPKKFIQDVSTNIAERLRVICSPRVGYDFNIHDSSLDILKSFAFQLSQHFLILFRVEFEKLCHNNGGEEIDSIRLFSIYEGLCGKLLLLLLIHQTTSTKNHISELIEQVIRLIMKQSKKNISQLTLIGLGVGIGSVVYALSYAAQELERKDLMEFVVNLISDLNLEQRIEMDTSLDIINGTAGLLLSLIEAKKALLQWTSMQHEKQIVENLICYCIEHLREKQSLQQFLQHQHRVWMIDNEAKSGFSHGQSGICYALSKTCLYLDPVFSDTIFTIQDMICKAIEYEDTLFKPSQYNWSDLKESYEPISMCSWCFGSPGIVASRMMKKRHANVNNDYPLFNGPVNKFLSNIMSSMMEELKIRKDMSLCCGKCGIIDCLFAIALANNDMLLRSQIEHYVKETLIQDVLRRKIEIPTEDLSLFKGMAGIVYTFIKAAYPSVVDSFTIF